MRYGDELSLEILNQFDNPSGQLRRKRAVRLDFAAGQLNAPFPSETFTLATVTFRTKALTSEDGSAIEFNTTLPRQSDVTFAGNSLLDSTEGSTIFITNATLTGAVTLEGRPTRRALDRTSACQLDDSRGKPCPDEGRDTRL